MKCKFCTKPCQRPWCPYTEDNMKLRWSKISPNKWQTEYKTEDSVKYITLVMVNENTRGYQVSKVKNDLKIWSYNSTQVGGLSLTTGS